MQDHLLTRALAGNREKLKPLGIDEAKVKSIMEKAISRGFLQWKIGGRTTKADKVSEFEAFLLSTRFLFIETAEIAAEIYAFRKYILDAGPDVRLHPSWEEFWAPMLVFLSMAWSTMKPDTQQAAQKLAEHYQIQYLGEHE